MRIIQTTILSLKQKQSLFELWNSEYPKKIGYNELSEFEDYLDGLLEIKHYLLMNDQNTILGWAFTFVREEEDWFGIIIDSNIHGRGFGTLLLNELKKHKSILNGWATNHQNDFKQNNEPYLSPIEFYSKNGFIVNENIRMENEKISAVKIRWERI
ncbi:GNAT family N-acetyltransferase [Flavobacterium sp. N3904]|uniref:GNAT family N-acetyltransferase n=1 Tax=Flavobacterium sp. N3904 TaxID=2986835 RepID=UPI0022242506|nr:GNAT family N-acetyltransferase [Flavobacterium sp. N3904]